ncbi:hypothetical protein J7F03_22800 [Streptomyces sp. ISL-43]|uniref:hypothetical protein n=1 Tax=Streptomyces sp. ISL-43 TaxID=2819183 RepID=UPI001BECD99D|nr:hypothetical protein [Streptomyces sp. ISL-43]MBT2449850.1 hypothetical protein [Streptomyces sp. ISL-43]
MSSQKTTMLGTLVPALRTWGARAARTALALPVGLASVALTGVGQGRRADRLQTWASGAPGWTAPRVTARILLGLPLDLAALVLGAYSVFNTVRNLGYPIWYGATDYHQAWGGPTLAGVWLVHALGWLACLYVIGWILKAMARAQHAIASRVTRTPAL